eukprot:CAMPEP_0195154260 /NCGR_PEP_ID=MMETSP0448-20130528/183564_1 /TAXON_ID=66468 /ORGANISM="Heterocapsa triquestra, Strain CCMP 448" /LENGTH=97 /DNA_ID=CAMNT_0040193033 /DNA_START=381 /DNA_END=675 /DNA_ORIENTATION=+
MGAVCQLWLCLAHHEGQQGLPHASPPVRADLNLAKGVAAAAPSSDPGRKTMHRTGCNPTHSSRSSIASMGAACQLWLCLVHHEGQQQKGNTTELPDI